MKHNSPNPAAGGRREFIKGMGVAATLSVVPAGLPKLVYAGSFSNSEDPGLVVVGSFTAASAALLGIPSNEIEPAIQQDNVSLAWMYYVMCFDANSDATLAFTNSYVYYNKIGYSDQDIANILLIESGSQNTPRKDATGVMSRLTMQMWLFGVWYGETEVKRIPSSKDLIPKDWQVDMVVASRGYKNAWIWRIAQAHPMGFSHFNFGSWADTPPSLTDYGIPE